MIKASKPLLSAGTFGLILSTLGLALVPNASWAVNESFKAIEDEDLQYPVDANVNRSPAVLDDVLVEQPLAFDPELDLLDDTGIQKQEQRPNQVSDKIIIQQARSQKPRSLSSIKGKKH